MAAMPLLDGELMKLIPIPAHHTDAAWNDGAQTLDESCAEECTIDQLKMLVARGERQLVRMDSEGKKVGWAVFRVDALPNFRVMHVTNLVAHNAHFEQFFSEVKSLAESLGCSRVRCCAKPAQARLYQMKLGFSPIYTTLEVSI